VRLGKWTFDRGRAAYVWPSPATKFPQVITAVVSEARETRNRGIFGSNPRSP
jgi:hypothetical protein